MRACLVAVVVLSVPRWAVAQVLQPPPRPSGGLFGGGTPPGPNRTRQELTLQGSALGGYDDNLAPPTGGEAVAPHPSGYIGFGDTTLRYWVGKDARSMEVSARSYMNTYRNVGVGPSYGGEQRLRARTTLGRRTLLEASQDLRYTPYFSLGLFGATQKDLGTEDPDRNPTNAITESGSWATGASTSLVHQWARRTSMKVDYQFSQQTYVHGVGFDSRVNSGAIALDQSLGRTVAIHAAYNHSDSEFTQRDGSRLPLLNRGVDLGFRYQRRLSRTRQMSFSGGAGAMYVDTVEPSTREPSRFWGTSGYGNLSLEVGRSWSVGADYRRSTSVLQGIAPEAFVSDVGTVSAGGSLQPWLETVFTAGYSSGVTGGGRTQGEAPGRYVGYTGAVQLSFRLTRWWSSVVSVNHYQYRLSTAASQSLGVSHEMNRNAVRVGFTWLLPLYGLSTERAEPLSGPRN